jgi:hypothetical protein
VPSQVEDPQFRTQGSNLPRGARTETDEGLALADAFEAQNEPVEADLDTESAIGVPEEEEDFGSLDEEDDLVFGPSERPDEPLEAGMPFGDGPDIPKAAIIDPKERLRRFASSAAATSDDPVLHAFLIRVARGE